MARVPDNIFEHPRLAAIYDALEADRSDLDVYVAIAEELGARRVLDVGCGEGFLAAELVKSGNRVTGVDILPQASQGAALAAYYRADLEEGLEGVVEQLNGKRFSCVLLLDVLEHLRYPERILAQCHKLLRPDGRIIVSVPNIANVTICLMLLSRRKPSPHNW